MRTMAMLDAPPRSDSIWPMNALSLPSSMFVVDMDVPPSKSYSLNKRSPGNAVEYTSVGSAIMPADRLSRVLAEQLHPAAQVIPALVNLNMPPTCLRRNQARCLRWVKNRPDGPEIRLPLYPRKRTQVGHRVRSEMCQQRTSVE